MRIGSLFAGIGGFDLAARWMGWETAWYSEIEPYACRVMAKHWPGVPNHGDITKIRGEDVERIDMLCGGFPCQDISLAGKGAGIEGERSGLWSHYARLIEELRPRWIVAENVAALRSRGLDRVLKDLAEVGYDAEWHCIPAAYVGAPHRRDRIWIVAYPATRGRIEERAECGGGRGSCPQGSNGSGPSFSGAGALAHTDRAGPQGLSGNVAGSAERRQEQAGPATAGCVRTGADEGWWISEPAVGRVAHGIPNRVDRLRCLGNAIVPQVAHFIFQQIEQYEQQR